MISYILSLIVLAYLAIRLFLLVLFILRRLNLFQRTTEEMLSRHAANFILPKRC
jgi:hypothetical protein